MRYRSPVFATLLCAFLALALPVAADSGSETTRRWALGPVLSRYQNEFGFGAEVVSTPFAGDSLAVGLSGRLHYAASLDWQRFGTFELSLFAGRLSGPRRPWLYGKAGVVALTPSDALSTEDLLLGGLGAFGFEFPLDAKGRRSYFLELGGVGIAARADKLSGNPIFANGFMTNVGMRFRL